MRVETLCKGSSQSLHQCWPKYAKWLRLQLLVRVHMHSVVLAGATNSCCHLNKPTRPSIV